MERFLTREEIIIKYPPQPEVSQPRPDSIKYGSAGKEFMVSRNDKGQIIFAVPSEIFNRYFLKTKVEAGQ